MTVAVTDLEPEVVAALEETGAWVEQVRGVREYFVYVGEGERHNVYQGSDDGDDPHGWYVDLVPDHEAGDRDEDGPYDSPEDAILAVFIEE